MTLPFDPSFLAEIQKMTPEQYGEFIIRLAQEIPTDVLIEQRKAALRIIAADTDGYENFLAYYELIHGTPLVEHDLDPVRKAFEAHARGEIFEWLGFRGCRKTTTIDITLGSFLHGHHPEGTGIVTGANDPNSKLIAKSIAQIIESHPEFRAVFPHILIDKERGWGAEGYWIRDGRMSRETWTAQQAKVNDPSFVGGGYKSSEINGKHPTLYLFVDDLHDIDSSSSVTERENIKTVFLTQILPTLVSEGGKLLAWVNITGVPFAKDDTYHVLKDSGGVVFVSLPVMKRVAEGTIGAVYIDGVNPKTGAVYEDIKGWWVLTWPENFNKDVIISWRSKGKSSFWQMFMLDIEIAKTAGLTYYLYPHDQISYMWPTYGGADPTNVEPDKEVGGEKRSSFALCYLATPPTGGAVVVDGFLKPCGILEAKETILRAQSMFSNWRTTAVENVGGGAVFLQYLRQDARVKCQASNLANPTQKRIADKKTRFLLETHPHMDNAMLRISDLETPFNMALRKLCDNFFDIDVKDEAVDAGDSLYHAMKSISHLFRISEADNLSPQALNSRGGLYHPLAGGIPHGR